MRLQTRLNFLNTKRETRPFTIIYFIYSPNGSDLPVFLSFYFFGLLVALEGFRQLGEFLLLWGPL